MSSCHFKSSEYIFNFPPRIICPYQNSETCVIRIFFFSFLYPLFFCSQQLRTIFTPKVWDSQDEKEQEKRNKKIEKTRPHPVSFCRRKWLEDRRIKMFPLPVKAQKKKKKIIIMPTCIRLKKGDEAKKYIKKNEHKKRV